MSQFYSRYTPSSRSVASRDASSTNSEKRKRTIDTEHSLKKQKLTVRGEKPIQRRDVVSEGGERKNVVKDTSNDGPAVRNVLDKYRVSATAQRHGSSEIKLRQQSTPTQERENAQNSKYQMASQPETLVQDDFSDPESEEKIMKHAGVLSKFGKSQMKSRAFAREENLGDTSGKSNEQEEVELHGLEPLPQPEETQLPYHQPSYNTLPAWQSNAVTVVPGTHPKFEEMNISKALLRNLHKHGMERAFPVQSTIIPLLLGGEDRHQGDLCISAATGSGKTLAYVLPLIEDIKDNQPTRLRGVIVVPTRELVQQVRQVCEQCADGTNIKLTTAVGSKSLKDEQDALVSEENIYDPEEYAKLQKSLINWREFSLKKTLDKFEKRDLRQSTNFVTSYVSKVDLLITTPGRLVDHLRNTPGFTLQDVKWLVIDEADRLLNESYQEWIEVVMPALQSQASTTRRDSLLRSMKMEVPKRQVTKVLLSATMTRDISKLNSLGLRNPKLIILGGASLETKQDKGQVPNLEGLPPDTDGIYHLPSTLLETVIPIKDPAAKPLYLLELLNTKVGSLEPNEKGSRQRYVGDSDSDSLSSTSSEDETSTDSDTTSSSSDDSESRINGQNAAQITSSSNTERARVLIFTRSTESATRLSRLLEMLMPSLVSQIYTFTRSTAASAKSRRAFSRFQNSQSSILIATDRASRGLDLAGLEHVISYDVPNSIATYIHRVGRTARAGKRGNAWTMVEHREAAWFWQEIGGKKKNEKSGTEHFTIHRTLPIQRVNISIKDEILKNRYEEVLKKLGEEVAGK